MGVLKGYYRIKRTMMNMKEVWVTVRVVFHILLFFGTYFYWGWVGDMGSMAGMTDLSEDIAICVLE